MAGGVAECGLMRVPISASFCWLFGEFQVTAFNGSVQGHIHAELARIMHEYSKIVGGNLRRCLLSRL